MLASKAKQDEERAEEKKKAEEKRRKKEEAKKRKEEEERREEDARKENARKDEEARDDTVALAAYNDRFSTPTSVTIPAPIEVVYENLANKLDVVLRMSNLSGSIDKIAHPDLVTMVVYYASGKEMYGLKIQNLNRPRYCEFQYTAFFTGDPVRTEQFMLKFQLKEQERDVTEILVSEVCLAWRAPRFEYWKQHQNQYPSLKSSIIPALYIWGPSLPKKDAADRDRDLKVVFGMVKGRKQIQLTRTAEKLGIPREKVEELIFELLGGNMVDGKFLDDDTFQITSDVGEAIKALEATFASWKRESGGKV